MADDITDALEAAHAQQRAAAVWASGITSGQAANIGNLSRVYPQLKPGVALSLGASGVDPDSPLAQQTAKTATEEHAHKGWRDRIGDVVSAASAPVRAAARVGLVVAEAPYEYIQGAAREVANIPDQGVVNAIQAIGAGVVPGTGLSRLATGDSAFSQTTLSSAATEAVTNDQSTMSDIVGSFSPGDKGRSVLGDGWFPSYSSPAGRRQIQAARAAAPLVDGHAFTFGRALASATPLDPGSKPYHIMSGLIDATSMIFLDPTTYVGGGIGKANRLRDVIGTGPAREFELATRERQVIQAGTPGSSASIEAPVARDIQAAYEGGPTLFHGTSRRFPNDAVNPDPYGGSGARNLFGYGFYTTESENIARTYMKKGATAGRIPNADFTRAVDDLRRGGVDVGSMSMPDVTAMVRQHLAKSGRTDALYNMRWTGTNPPKVLNLDRSRTPAVRDFVEHLLDANHIDGVVDDAARIRRMIADKASDAEVLQNARHYLEDAGITASHADEIFADLADTLRGDGYDVLSHMGGKYVASSTGEHHKVSIFLDPGKLKAVDVSPAAIRATAAIAPTPEITGMVDGIRKTVLPEKAHAWLAGPDGSKVADYLAAETDFERMRRTTGRKLPVSLLIELKDASDPVTVKNLLADAVNAGAVREAPTVGGSALAAVGVDDSVWSVFRRQMGSRQAPRWTQAVPTHKIDLDNMDDAVEQLDRFQRNAKLPEDVISRNNEALARAGSGGESLQVFEATMNAVKGALVQGGLKERDATRLTTMFKDRDNAYRAYFVDAAGDPVAARPSTANLGGTNAPLISPHLASELIDRYIPLPDARDIKRATSALKPLFDLPVVGTTTRGVIEAADILTTDLFKTFALAIRPAWTVRVVGEEQARMAAAGLVSAFAHPFSYLAWVAGDDATHSATRPLIAALRKTRRTQRGGTDVLGEKFTDIVAADATSAVAQALNRGSSGWRDRHIVSTNYWDVFDKTSEHYVDSWLDELTQLVADPVARSVSRESLPQAQARFWAVGKDREKLMKAGFNGDPGKWDVTTRAGADAYVASVLDRVTIKTSSDPDLIGAVATGKLQGMHLTDGVAVNPKARKVMQEKLDQGLGPEKVKGKIRASGGNLASGIEKAAQHWDSGAEAMFNALGAIPTNRLSRSPAFRQFYWQRIGEVAGLVDGTAREGLLGAARAANLPKAQIRNLEKTLRSSAGGSLSLKQADTVAKMHALHETRDLLYDLHNRGQAFDALRVVIPFGEAWREVLTRWAKLANPVTGNPMVGYRLNQVIGEARKGGVFYPDPTTGEEMYAYPGGEMLSEMLTGVPVKIQGAAQGLNTVTGAGTGILPGVGPVVQWPVAAFLPDSPNYDDVRAMVNPYGEPDVQGGFVESMLPAYMRKVLTRVGYASPDQKRALASTTRDVMAYLYSSGDYDASTPDGQAKLLKDAQGKAKTLYFLRGLAQSTAPTAPSYEYAVKDKDGHITAMHLVADEYRTLLNEDPDTATEKLLDTYGEAVFLATVGKTTGGAPTTEEVSRLARTHPDVALKFPNVWGLFTDPSSPFDPSESTRQVKAGQRQQVTPREALDKAQQRLGSAMYDQYRAMVPANPSDEQRMWLLKARAAIKKKYPGYAATPAGLGDSERAVDEVIRAAGDPVLAQTDAGRGLAMYLQYREQAVQAAQAGGLASFGSADAALPLRMWLRAAADKITQLHPDFSQLWDRVLDRELKDDSEATQ